MGIIEEFKSKMQYNKNTKTNKKKIVLTYGTFDLFHYGHLFLLERCKKLGDELYVFLSTDEFNALKGKKAIMDFAERAEVLLGTKPVDRIYEEREWAQKLYDVLRFQKLGYEVIVAMGDDWEGKFDDLPCEVIYLPRTEEISSTMIRGRVINEYKNTVKHE